MFVDGVAGGLGWLWGLVRRIIRDFDILLECHPVNYTTLDTTAILDI